jgi:hypothetical protein
MGFGDREGEEGVEEGEPGNSSSLNHPFLQVVSSNFLRLKDRDYGYQ